MKKIKFFILLILVSTVVACQANQAILNSQPKPVADSSPEQPKDPFQRALRGVQSGDFTYILVFRRKDGGVFVKEDNRFIKANTPRETNQFVLTDDERAVIAGSNFPFPPENTKILSERFNIEDFSKPEAKTANNNTNNSNN